jgi:hypothetical protein
VSNAGSVERQGKKFDPDRTYVKRWLPVPEPWRLGPQEQQAACCRIGRDYPAPITARLTGSDGALNVSHAMDALGRVGEPEEVASGLAWLLDPGQS